MSGGQISAQIQNVANDVVIAPTSRIVADRVFLGSGVVIEEDVTIRADEIHIGYRSKIQRRTSIAAIGGPAERVSVGDFSVIGNDTTVLVPVFTIGDYSAVHNHVLINGYKPCTIGHNAFVGQHS